MSESPGGGAPFQTIPEYGQAPASGQRQSSKRSKSLNRKTSAEIVKEAKTMLANSSSTNANPSSVSGGIRSYSSLMLNHTPTQKFEGGFRGSGARLVSTRRPITPREPGRQLYSRAAPPGRPPSAFSLRYLQFERGALPNLDPIPQPIGTGSVDSCDLVEVDSGYGVGFQTRAFQRSESTGSIADNDTGLLGLRGSGGGLGLGVGLGAAAGMGKLPALLIPPKIAASLDNLSEGMPPRKDFKQPRESEGTDADGTITPGQGMNVTVDSSAITGAHPMDCATLSREHPMKKMQAKSHDGHGISLGLGAEKPNVALLNSSAFHKSSSSTSKESLKLNRSNDLLAQSSTETLLDMLKAHAGIKECSEETEKHINGILTELYSRVKGARGRWRCAVLGALYGLVECSSSRILLAVARVVLALRVTGSNLTGACKLIFKVARNETNDFLFIDCDVAELLIEGLGRASPVEEPEACVYGYGAVRFLANSHLLTTTTAVNNIETKKESRNKCLAFRLAHHGAVQLMVVHLQILNEAGSTTALTGAPLHALFQLSSALRALAGNAMVVEAVNHQNNPVSFTSSTLSVSEECPDIRESLEGVVDIQMELAGPQLVKSAEICMTDTETQFNIIRTLSALSDIDKCCSSLSEYTARLAILLGPVPVEKDRGGEDKPLGLLSRLGYILGNVVGKYDSARLNIFNNDVAMEHLVNSLDHYSRRKFNGLANLSQAGSSPSSSVDTVIDVAVKLVRVVANMGVNAEVGEGLVRRSGLGACLLHLVETISQILTNKEEETTPDVEELLLATLGALHNLSFYHELRGSGEEGNGQQMTSENNHQMTLRTTGTVNDRIAELSAALVKILQNGSIAAKAEAARVLGNMSRSYSARESICHAGGLKILVRNLESEDFELVASSCGVLVNILGDWERRATFRELRGPLLLRDVLQRSAGQDDWLLAGIVCQALWNYLIDTTDLVAALGEDEADYIAGDLVQYLEEGGGRGVNDGVGEGGDELYEQFCTVASDLLERVQTSISLTHSPAVSLDMGPGVDRGAVEEDGDDVSVVGEIGDKWGGRFQEWLEQ